MKYCLFLCVFTISLCLGSDEVPPYIRQCKEDDPNITDCILAAINHVKPWMAKGIPEIGAPGIEPFIIDELSLSLTSGPNGYKITLKNLEAFGASNYTIDYLKLSDGDKPFEARVRIPELKIKSDYRSSGVLIILPASGGGELTGTFGDVTALVQGKVKTEIREDGKKYMKCDKLIIDFRVKTPRLRVDKIFNNNRILNEATNLFLRENGHEVLKAMAPQLNKKLARIFKNLVNKVVQPFPISVFLVPANQS